MEPKDSAEFEGYYEIHPMGVLLSVHTSAFLSQARYAIWVYPVGHGDLEAPYKLEGRLTPSHCGTELSLIETQLHQTTLTLRASRNQFGQNCPYLRAFDVANHLGAYLEEFRLSPMSAWEQLSTVFYTAEKRQSLEQISREQFHALVMNPRLMTQESIS